MALQTGWQLFYIDFMSFFPANNGWSIECRWFLWCLRLSFLMLLVANLADTKWCKKTWKMTETRALMGAHLRVLSESYLMNANMRGFRYFQKSSHQSASDESRLSIGRVKCWFMSVVYLHISITQFLSLVMSLIWNFIDSINWCIFPFDSIRRNMLVGNNCS